MNFHIETYCDDLDEKGPHIFGQKFEIPAIVQPQPWGQWQQQEGQGRKS